MTRPAPPRAVSAEMEALLQPKNFDQTEASFTLSIAATDYALRTVIVPFFAATRAKSPEIRVLVRPVDGEKVHALLEKEEIDLAVMTPETVSPDSIEQSKGCTEKHTSGRASARPLR
jgi:DNA-binding transcriptional LysR family regulator